ncbi:MAG: DUF1385 domain-containing protein [Oscillospiraceae bacterium]|nr:DUF1385 domain-containing protein [Oscillospiraceae bacterium]
MEKKECFKTKIGGQAVIEGIAMRGPKQTCLAVRTPEGEIHTELYETKKNKLAKVPVFRGAAAMILSLAAGYKYLMRAADLAFPEEAAKEEESEKKSASWLAPAAGVLGGLMAIALFVLLPTALTGLLARFVPLDGFKTLIEGFLKILIFIGYLFAVTRLNDIKRVFQYHGAEHKTIACYEHRAPLTVESVRGFSRFHPRCGTSFMFIVILISILVFSFVPWGNTFARVGLKLLCLPLIMGISYEIIQFAGAHDNLLTKILSAPGLWVQRLTAFEPEDDMIEVAIASLIPVLPESEDEAEWSAS